MKKSLIWVLTIATFILMIPVGFLFFCLLATIQQGHPVNGIIQAVVMFICSIGFAYMASKGVYDKLNHH